MGPNVLPKFCDNDPYLAMAILDGTPLCTKCLLEEVENSPDQNIMNKIRPILYDCHNPTLPKEAQR